ncbi:Trm112 family protein [Candidatus Acetothermia bacterium]|nr:Trm112 family protein [Candidatus Acetothermia bacterium]MBI3642975.1 Trm112 family protein [Candidatus Acetothermia bacterium]
MPIKKELLAILACPQCKSSVELYKNTWLICSNCSRKYPIKNNIPVLLIEVGDQFKEVSQEQLPDLEANESSR